jgi:hypothetical protein
MGKKHEGLAYPLKAQMPYLVEQNRQGKGKEGGKYQEKKIQIEGVSDNHRGGIAFKEEFKVFKSVKGAAKNPQAVIETLKGEDNIGVRTIAVYKRIEGGRQQQ